MQLEEACSILVKVEQEIDVNSIKFEEVCLWPLIRHCLWFSLLGRDLPQTEKEEQKSGFAKLISKMAVRIANKILRLLKSRNNNYFIDNEPTTIFFSRPEYLQKLDSALLFDRIIDPLVFLARNREKISKCYLKSWPENGLLYYQANNIPVVELIKNIKVDQKVKDKIYEIAQKANLSPEKLSPKFDEVWSNFIRWYITGIKFFSKNQTVKRIYVTSWYFPDMMGLIAAAKLCGIETIDVQHGKQGKYQGMYSWWTKTPKDGYKLMPDRFWCWGKPSCNHMIESNNKCSTHRPFVGGYPWLGFYKKFVSSIHNKDIFEKKKTEYNQKILMTLQASQGEHGEPIPDFILNFLNSDKSDSVHITFRCHPNFIGCDNYCVSRLKNVQSEKYKITSGKSNLYDDLLKSTHHITAYSSCCYEADAFGVPTLLFGSDALAIYDEEIRLQIFSWTDGKVKDISLWLNKTDNVKIIRNKDNDLYIESSLVLAEKMLYQISNEKSVS